MVLSTNIAWKILMATFPQLGLISRLAQLTVRIHSVHFDLLKNTLASCHTLLVAATQLPVPFRMALSNMASRSNFGVTRSNVCLRSSDAMKSFLHSCADVANFITIPTISDAHLPTRTPIHSVETSCGCCTYSRIVTEERTSTHSTTWPMITGHMPRV